jgi:hypothetical protein
MFALPDPDRIRTVADRIDHHAAATRACATDLTRQLATVTWHGPAAEAFDRLAEPVIHALVAAAGHLDHAAGLLRRHAARVEAVLAELRRAGLDLARCGGDVLRLLRDGVRPGDLVHDAGRLLGDGASTARDAAHAVGGVLHSVGL